MYRTIALIAATIGLLAYAAPVSAQSDDDPTPTPASVRAEKVCEEMPGRVVRCTIAAYNSGGLPAELAVYDDLQDNLLWDIVDTHDLRCEISHPLGFLQVLGCAGYVGPRHHLDDVTLVDGKSWVIVEAKLPLGCGITIANRAHVTWTPKGGTSTTIAVDDILTVQKCPTPTPTPSPTSTPAPEPTATPPAPTATSTRVAPAPPNTGSGSAPRERAPLALPIMAGLMLALGSVAWGVARRR